MLLCATKKAVIKINESKFTINTLAMVLRKQMLKLF